jgi:predicted nucleotidyltransferase
MTEGRRDARPCVSFNANIRDARHASLQERKKIKATFYCFRERDTLNNNEYILSKYELTLQKKMLDQITIENIVANLKRFEPDKVILFGSQSTGLANNDSDIDLLIVKNIPENNIRNLRLEIKLALWSNLNSLQKHFDVIVDSEERIQQRILMGDLFYKEIYTNGTNLYV